MSKNLVIVESPAKAKTINKYLGKNYIVEATVGHFKNLPKSKIGIDFDNFTPQFVTIRGKGEIIKRIKTIAAKAKSVYIATDPDREGEAIAQDIADILPAGQKNVYRVLFNEITQNGIKRGMDSPREIHLPLVSSQRARRVMDRIIGYKISPFLWKAAIEESQTPLSAGRVQSVALRLICEKEEEISRFRINEYWSIWGIFDNHLGGTFKAKLYSIDGREVKLFTHDKNDPRYVEFLQNHIELPDEATTRKYYNEIKEEKDFLISNISKRTIRRNPAAPFITSTLQSEASKVLRFRARQTMTLAQKLYEGLEIGNSGRVGLITYMRTDSTRLSKEIVDDARNFIGEKYGNDFVPESPNYYNKSKNPTAQDAHEAIRPTSLQYPPEVVKPFVDDNIYKLYSLIWNRFLASQMKNAVLETTVVEINAGKFLFKAYGQALIFEGYMKLYSEQQEPSGKEEDKAEAKNEILPAGLEIKQKMYIEDLKLTQHFTKPPPRYTESSLIKELESKGIGRPSTYSSILSTIIDREYVTIKDRTLFPTDLGLKINSILVRNFPNIVDVGFTARMEAELDQIAQSENGYVEVLSDFYIPFSDALKQVEANIEKIICEKCGGEMDMKMGRFGRFLACNNYPECSNIKSLKEVSGKATEVEYTGETCEKCGNRTVYRNSRYGKFIGCEKYPDCDFVKNISLNLSCPKCQTGEVIIRKSRKGKMFYGCSNYPKCDFVAWYKPVNDSCPECANNYLEERYAKKKGNYLKCPACSHEIVTEYSEDLDE
ncbi:MAG: type I DNA topoisomerase [Ignavibacteriaceae bacterium]|nr:type I DNA topoisomerase [Ignavibacteriaceae bacterium]